MNSKKQSIILAILLIVSTSMLTMAQDRIFTYTYQSNVLTKGQREIESWNTLRQGKINFFSRLDNRTEFEIGLGNNLQTSFYLNLTTKTKTIGENNSFNLETEHEIGFSNEWKLKLSDPVAHPVGIALYAEYGISSNEYELEGKLILDKKINNLTIAGNITYEAEFVPAFENGKLVWEKEKQLAYNLAFGYNIGHGFHLTQENNLKNIYVDNALQHNAIYSGLGFSYLHDAFWVNFTAMPQLVAFKGKNSKNLNLDEFEKVQLRLLFSYAF